MNDRNLQWALAFIAVTAFIWLPDSWTLGVLTALNLTIAGYYLIRYWRSRRARRAALNERPVA